MASRIKSGDLVVVISGGDKGKTGKVLRVITGKNRVLVEGINRVWKNVKPKSQGQPGSRIQKDAPIHVSNVLPVDPATGKATRVKFEIRDGVKHRVAKSGTSLGVVSKVAAKK